MDRYYNINPFNRRYSEDGLREIREQFLGKQEAQPEGGSFNETGWLGSVWNAVLSLPAKMGFVEGGNAMKRQTNFDGKTATDERREEKMIKALTTKTRLWALTAAVFMLSLLGGASLGASDAHARMAIIGPGCDAPTSATSTADSAVELAQETMTAYGVLERQGVTTYQYGTHAITNEASGIRYALSSSYLDLDCYVGQRVTVTGTAVDGYPVDGGPVHLEVTKVEPPEADYTAPTVNQVSPQGTRVSPRANVTATFSEAMNAETFTTNTFTLKRKGAAYPVSATVSYDDAGEKAILDPSHKLRRGAVYIATIRGGMCGGKDEAGNPLAANEIWSFRVRT